MDWLLTDFKKATENERTEESLQIILKISQLFDEELSEVKYGKSLQFQFILLICLDNIILPSFIANICCKIQLMQ